MISKYRLALAAVIAFGTGPTAADKTPPPVAISVWTHAAEFTAEFEALRDSAEIFNRSQSMFRADIFPSIHRNYEDRVQTGAMTGTLPCLLEVDGPFVYTFAWPGYLQPLDRFVSRELLDDFLPSIVAQGTYEGRLYSLAQYDSGLALWGNRRYLRAAGLRIPTFDAPWSLAEFESAMEQLGALEELDYAISFNTHVRNNEFYSYAYAPILQGFGGDLIERKHYRTSRGILNGPQSVEAMKHFQQWFARGWTRAVLDRPDDFETGRVALSWIGHWKYASYRAALGDDLVLMPLPDFGYGIKTGMGSWNWAISSTCRHSAGAWRFLEHLLSRTEILRMTTANSAVPARRSVLSRSPLYGPHGPMRILAQQLAEGAGVPRPATPAYGAIRNAYSEAVSAIISGTDVQTALDLASARVEEDIARNRGYPKP